MRFAARRQDDARAPYCVRQMGAYSLQIMPDPSRLDRAAPYVDHLIITALTLEAGQDYVAERLGVRPVFGGTHPATGTSNALLGLGPETYLEVIAPPAVRTAAYLPLPFGLECSGPPRLTSWSAGVGDLAGFTELAQASGVDIGPSIDGGRATADGTHIAWRFSDIYLGRYGGLFPFFIEWGDTHPADGLDQSCRLAGFAIVSDNEALIRSVQALSLPVDIVRGGQPGLSAQIETPRGMVTLD